MNSKKWSVTDQPMSGNNRMLLGFSSIFFALALLVTPYGAAQTSPVPIRFLLTFDDGPAANIYNNSTEQVLDVLAHNTVQPGIKAIFFTQTRAVNGGGTAIGRKLMQREWSEGHLLAFHTATPRHSNHRYLTDQELAETLQTGISDLTGITGVAPQLVRPPFWNYDLRTFTAYQQAGLHMLLTDLSANDGKIWGVNFSFHKHSNLLKMLTDFKPHWLAGELPVVDGAVPVIVTFHDVNTYTSNHIEVYLQILLQVASELDMPTTREPFYNQRDAIERAALARTISDGSHREQLPGFWDWLWH